MDEVFSELSLCPFPDTQAVAQHLPPSSYLHMSGFGGNVGFNLDIPFVYGGSYSGMTGPRLEPFSQGPFLGGDNLTSYLPSCLREGWKVQECQW